MSRQPRLSGKVLIALFQKKGWQLVRVRGSHHVLKNEKGEVAVVPVHGNKEVHVGIVNKLLRKHLRMSEAEIAEL